MTTNVPHFLKESVYLLSGVSSILQAMILLAELIGLKPHNWHNKKNSYA